MTHDVKEGWGLRLKQLIKDRWDGTQGSFAEAVGLSEGQLSRLVNERNSLRASGHLDAIAEKLDVSPATILYGENGSDDLDPPDRVAEPHPTYGGPDDAHPPIATIFVRYVEKRGDTVGARLSGVEFLDDIIAEAASRGSWSDEDQHIWDAYKAGLGYRAPTAEEREEWFRAIALPEDVVDGATDAALGTDGDESSEEEAS